MPDDMQQSADDSRPISGEGEADMAVQSRDLRPPQVLPDADSWRRRAAKLVYLVTGVLALLAAYGLMGALVERARIAADDMRYGRPRTTHLDGFVGHGESRGSPTHLMAINLERRVVIVELPGSDPSVARVMEGPYLFGADESLTPIELLLQDVDGDGTLDLLVTVRREQVVYLNKDGVFRLPTAAEQAELSRGKP
jgi:hypothetical protein